SRSSEPCGTARHRASLPPELTYGHGFCAPRRPLCCWGARRVSWERGRTPPNCLRMDPPDVDSLSSIQIGGILTLLQSSAVGAWSLFSLGVRLMLRAFARWLLRNEAEPTRKRHVEPDVSREMVEAMLEEHMKQVNYEW